jgi:hypothetical protein
MSQGLPLFLKGEGTRSRESRTEQALEADASRAAEAAVSGRAAGMFEPSAATPAHGPDRSVPASEAGTPLASDIRARVEPAAGGDLSDVRVHQSGADRELAGAVGARAFTQGRDIWLGPRESSSDVRLMAHEARHVVQQRPGGGPSAIQKQQAQTTPTTTPAQLAAYIQTPATEKDDSVRKVLGMLNQYKPTVDLNQVTFQVMATAQSYIDPNISENGRSHWDGGKPIIELTQDQYDTIGAHLAGTAPINQVHDVLRTVAHELYHLYREKTGNANNPLQPLFGAEAGKRMEEIRQNWIRYAQDPGGAKALGVPTGMQVTKWEDIPEAERKKIEAGASQTSVIQGLYEHTAYLVEETYVKIEELSYLRVEQAAEKDLPRRPSGVSVTELAKMIGRLSTALDTSVGSDFMTAELLLKTRAAMLQYLRKRYPHKGDPGVDSYEVIFYLSAKDSGLPPIYGEDGRLISVKPPEARLP